MNKEKVYKYVLSKDSLDGGQGDAIAVSNSEASLIAHLENGTDDKAYLSHESGGDVKTYIFNQSKYFISLVEDVSVSIDNIIEK